MSIVLSRRDALKGAMAAGAALAASPYLLNLTGGVSAAVPAQSVPAQPVTASLPVASGESAAQSGQTTVLVIKGDVVSSYRGLQSVKVTDGTLASKLRSVVSARYE